MAFFKSTQTQRKSSSRRSRRAGTKSKVIGHAKSKPPKSRYSRAWKICGVPQPTAKFAKKGA